MERRDFIKNGITFSLASFLPWELAAFGKNPDQAIFQPSFTFNYILLGIQKVILENTLAGIDKERILLVDFDSRQPGNAFFSGAFVEADPRQLILESRKKLEQQPLAMEERYQMAYAYGAIVAHSVKQVFANANAMDYIHQPDKAALIDSELIKTFYLKQTLTPEVSKSHIEQMLNAFVSRTMVRYHTLKAHPDHPLEWIEATIAMRKAYQDHIGKVASLLVNGKENLPHSILNPKDKLLSEFSFGKKYTQLDEKDLRQGLESGQSLLSQAIYAGILTLIDA